MVQKKDNLTHKHKENKIIPKSYLTVFSIRLFVIHQTLKNTLKRQKGKEKMWDMIIRIKANADE